MTIKLLPCGHARVEPEGLPRCCITAAFVEHRRLKREGADEQAIYRAAIRESAVGARGLAELVRRTVADLAAATVDGARSRIGLSDVWQLGGDMGCHEASDAMEAVSPRPVAPEQVWPALRAFAEAAGWGLSDAGEVSTSVDAEAALIYRKVSVSRAGSPWWMRVDGAEQLDAFAHAEARALAEVTVAGGAE